jgi:hypothetical protein
VIAPASFCAFTVNNTKQPGSTPIVTERLHFLTDAVNNNQVSFEINGAENTKAEVGGSSEKSLQTRVLRSAIRSVWQVQQVDQRLVFVARPEGG